MRTEGCGAFQAVTRIGTHDLCDVVDTLRSSYRHEAKSPGQISKAVGVCCGRPIRAAVAKVLQSAIRLICCDRIQNSRA